jgi:hypothetical protein
VLNTVAYSLFFVPASVAAGQMINSLAQTRFPIKLKPGTLRFFGNGWPAFFTHAQAAHHGNHICFFCIALADCRQAYLVQFYLLTKA